MNSRWFFLSTLMLGQVAASAWADSTGFYDYARVVDVDPILEGRVVPVSRRVCDKRQPTRAAIAATIGADIRLQDARWNPTLECRQLVEQSHSQRIVGYRVSYIYGGQKQVRRLPYDPGDRVRVRVRMSARPR